mmetsp:Transcript_2907/g.4594  ORF Transcript_2907/g.4594 Transcript_2907/m.4594 type:complete len:85 (-) Transcript_2907:1710-1964(-)
MPSSELYWSFFVSGDSRLNSENMHLSGGRHPTIRVRLDIVQSYLISIIFSLSKLNTLPSSCLFQGRRDIISAFSNVKRKNKLHF